MCLDESEILQERVGHDSGLPEVVQEKEKVGHVSGLSEVRDLDVKSIIINDEEAFEDCDPTLMVWEHQYAKTVKADDAEVPLHLWDARVWRV